MIHVPFAWLQVGAGIGLSTLSKQLNIAGKMLIGDSKARNLRNNRRKVCTLLHRVIYDLH